MFCKKALLHEFHAGSKTRGDMSINVYPLYIFPSIFFYFKDLQDSTLQDTVSHKCKKTAWKLSIYLDVRSI